MNRKTRPMAERERFCAGAAAKKIGIRNTFDQSLFRWDLAVLDLPIFWLADFVLYHWNQAGALQNVLYHLDNIGQSLHIDKIRSQRRVAKGEELAWWMSRMFSASTAAVWVQGLGLRVEKSRIRAECFGSRFEVLGSKVYG